MVAIFQGVVKMFRKWRDFEPRRGAEIIEEEPRINRLCTVIVVVVMYIKTIEDVIANCTQRNLILVSDTQHSTPKPREGAP